MIYCKDWENVYAEMLQCVDEQIDWKRLVDVSVGSFRISKEYLKNMRKKEPACGSGAVSVYQCGRCVSVSAGTADAHGGISDRTA